MPELIDLETKLVAALIADDVLAGNVSTRLPRDFEEHLPHGTLQRAPGSRLIDTNTKTLEAVRLQLNTYGPIGGDVVAFEAFAELAAGLTAREGLGIGGDGYTPDAFVTEVDITPPWWSPDPETHHAGYIGYATVFVKGYATVT